MTLGQAPPFGGLVAVSRSSNYVAASWDLVLAGAAITVTLPDTPRTGTVVGVRALSGNCTVQRGGSNAIALPIGSSVTSFTLYQGSSCYLIFDGSQWASIADYPMQWTALSLVAGWTAYGSGYGTPEYALDQANRVHLRGLAKFAPTGSYGPSGALLSVALPAALRPSDHRLFIVSAQCAPAAEGLCRLDVLSTGLMNWVAAPTNLSGGYLSFNGVSWSAAG